MGEVPGPSKAERDLSRVASPLLELGGGQLAERVGVITATGVVVALLLQ
ncbi:hypothetical protein [Streptomyces sp. NPDC020330]